MQTLRTVTFVIAAIAVSTISAFGQEARTGTVSRLDEAKGTIAVSETQSGTVGGGNAPLQEYRVADGLLFNALKEGDRIAYSVEEKDGLRTIVKLQKQ